MSHGSSKLTHAFILALAAAMTSGLSGCGGSTDNLPRESVWGKVTLDGQPLGNGSITFDPDGPNQSHPVSGGALISGGSYSISAADGLTPGMYRVSIMSSGGAAPADAMPGLPPKAAVKDPVPEKYNSRSTLKVEVKGGAKNSHDFPLTSR